MNAIPDMECCVCMAEESSELPALRQEDNENQLVSLNDLDAASVVLMLIKGGKNAGAAQLIVRSACKEHAICTHCLHQLATSYGGNHPIGYKHPMIPCPYPFKECVTIAGVANYFPHALIEKILLPPDVERYRAHAARYQFPGFEVVPCPRPARFGSMCGAGILVSLESIRSTPVGRLILHCDQVTECQRHTCYHCKSLVHRSRDYCDTCVMSMENTNPKLPNCYFHRLDKTAGDGKPNLYRNEELTEEIVMSQLLEIANADRLEVRCTECLTMMYKTELCNTLEHCGIERCFSCGRSGTATRKLADHWDTGGYKGCPRFDHSAFWNVMAGCGFRCVEGECYGGAIGDCRVAEHQPAIQCMINTRKRAHLYHALKSLLPELRDTVMARLSLLENGRLRALLPRCWSGDYRTYLPDCIRARAEQAKAVIDNRGKLLDGRTFEVLETIVSKAGVLSFIDIAYPPLPASSSSSSSAQSKAELLFERFKSRYMKPRKRICLKKNVFA
jgi:hypothetical protein